MTANQMENIFKPFYTASGGGETGTGIGLYVVKLSAEAMGGCADVSSVVGKGSDFRIVIPVRHDKAVETCVAPVCADDGYVPSAEGFEKNAVDHEGEEAPRILIVEDRPEVARWEMRQLDSRYSFWFASDGAEGLRLAEDIIPDLIITDIMMPVMDGLEMCRRVRASELLSHIPVIMVTAKAGQEDRIAGFEAGADAYIEKPYDEEELSVRVRTLLDQREMLKFRYSLHSSENTSDTDVRGYSVKDKAFLDRFNEVVEASFAKGKVDCEAIASELCVGRVQLNRKIKAITGCKTTEYIHELRIAKAKDLLESTPLSIGEIALKCGIEDVGYFSTLFRKAVGMTPSVYRNR
jgi:DNA-binding response OmpR family regulator